MSAPPPSVDWAVEGPGLLDALRLARDLLCEYEQALNGEQFNSLEINAAIARATPAGEAGT